MHVLIRPDGDLRIIDRRLAFLEAIRYRYILCIADNTQTFAVMIQIDERVFVHIDMDRIDLFCPIFAAAGDLDRIVAGLQFFLSCTNDRCGRILCFCRDRDRCRILRQMDPILRHIR